jgi:serine/threonine-protein kinase
MADVAKYIVLHELGAGGMGTIHKGALVGQAGFQRPIVIKKLRYAGDPSHVKLFVDEARRYALLDHENIGRIFDFEEVGGELSIILEFIDGWSLVEYLERHRQIGKKPDLELAVFIVSRVCRALQYVFEKSAIVHRDISPSNIMMTREGAVKLIDFGIATKSGRRDSSLTGKPAYMAPEMIVEMRADNRSDVFSLGTVFYEMLTGERLFSGATTAEILEQVVAGTSPSPRNYNPDIPDGVLVILRRSLERDPPKRYASAAEMGEACEHVLYDKGYGPTNLSLKQYLMDLFPDGGTAALEGPAVAFPLIEPTLLPISDAASPHTRPPGDATPITPLTRPPQLMSSTLSPLGGDPTRARRIKSRTRPR